MSRIILTNNLNIYIDATNGNNITGDGSINNPFATLQFAHDYVQQNYDLGNKYTIIYQTTGNFTTGVIEKGPLCGQLNELNEIYNFTSGSSVTANVNSYAFQALYGAMFTVQQLNANLTIQAPGSLGIGGGSSNGGIIAFGPGVTFSNCGLRCVETSWGGTIYMNGGFVAGSNESLAFASGGVIQFNPGFTTYITNNPTYSKAIIRAYGGGMIGIAGHTFTGFCYGQGICAELNGTVSGCPIGTGTQPEQKLTGGQCN